MKNSNKNTGRLSAYPYLFGVMIYSLGKRITTCSDHSW